MEKRGQVTLYIIIGVLILIAGSVVVYLNSNTISSKLGFGEDISAQMDSAQILLDECTKNTLKDAVLISANQGGRIYTKITTPAYYEKFTSSLQYYPNGNVYMPYWFYETSGIPYKGVPTLSQTETDIAIYLEKNIYTCLQNFTSLKQGISVKYSGLKFKATIYDSEVGAIIKTPLQVIYKDESRKIPLHEVKIPTKYKQLYDTAIKIMDKENQEYFFEEKTYDMMVLYPEIPKSETTLDCSPKVWTRQEIINNFKEVISINTPYYKIKGSDYTLAKESRKYFELTELELPQGTNVNFIYNKAWPFEMSIIGQNGNIIRSDAVKSSSVSKLASLFCINDYNFVYDVKYPLIISVSSENEAFQFATQVIIDNNEPRKLTIEPLFAEDRNDIYCSSIYDSQILVYSEGTPIEGADVEYQCVNHGCALGITNSEGTIASGIPACVNGILKVTKEGYADYQEDLSTNLGDFTKTVELQKLTKLNTNLDIGRSLSSKERIILTIRNQDTEEESTIIYPTDKELSLTPGTYSVDAIIVSEETSRIEEEKVKECINDLAGVCIDYYEDTLPGMELKNSIIGGGKFDFTIDDLSNKNSITIYLYSSTIPTTYSGLAEIQDTIENYQNSEQFKQPLIE